MRTHLFAAALSVASLASLADATTSVNDGERAGAFTLLMSVLHH